MEFFQKDDQSALEAKSDAQWIAWAPFIFQASKALRDLGVLEFLKKKGKKGATIQEVSDELELSYYGTRVLLESSLGMGLTYLLDNKNFVITKKGFFVQTDPMTNINMDFVHDVCYRGMTHLKESIINGKPEGLKELGEWDTIYEGLSELPGQAKDSWFKFDHFFSDNAFDQAIPFVKEYDPKVLYDIGGNTGKFSMKLVDELPDLDVWILDLPGQIELARKNLEEHGYKGKVNFYPIDVLKDDSIPEGADAIWMSQFLDCFGDEEIIRILDKARRSLPENGRVHILETFWDHQQFEVGALSLQQISLYFTVMANGNSQMYRSEDFKRCIEKAGLNIVQEERGLGIGHTLLTCMP